MPSGLLSLGQFRCGGTCCQPHVHGSQRLSPPCLRTVPAASRVLSWIAPRFQSTYRLKQCKAIPQIGKQTLPLPSSSSGGFSSRPISRIRHSCFQSNFVWGFRFVTLRAYTTGHMQGIWCIIGFIIGAVTVYFFTKPRLLRAESNAANERVRADEAEKQRQKLEIDLAAARVHEDQLADVTRLIAERDLTIRELDKQYASLSTSIEEREKALKEEREQLDKRDEHMKAKFTQLSAEALKANSEQFLDNAKRVLDLQYKAADSETALRQEKIAQLVKPIQDGIKAIGDATKDLENKREKAFGSIEEQLRQSIEQAAEVARQASGLKDALKKPTVRGRWGEVQLKNCIELAQMEEHCDVTFQDSSLGYDERVIRPDMTVRMPGGRKIAVDAKTPMDAFLQYIDATTDEAKSAALFKHGKAVRAHISNLAKTDYMQKLAGSPDFVVMFLPNESFLAMALEKEPSLMEDALSKKILITTPGTLIGLLKVIRYGWTEQKLAVNAQKISDEGAKLNTELTRFLEDFAKLGNALKAALKAYDDSSRRVERQITSASGKLAQLGAKSRKALTGKAVRSLPSSEEVDDDTNYLLPIEESDSEIIDI